MSQAYFILDRNTGVRGLPESQECHAGIQPCESPIHSLKVLITIRYILKNVDQLTSNYTFYIMPLD